MERIELDRILSGAKSLKVTLSNGCTLTIHREDLATQGDFAKSMWAQTGCRVRGDHEEIARALGMLADEFAAAA